MKSLLVAASITLGLACVARAMAADAAAQVARECQVFHPLRDPQEALDCLNQRLKARQAPAAVLLRLRGDFHQRWYRYDRALADYGAAIEADPRSVEAYVQRADLHYGQNRETAAIADASKAIRLDQENFRAWRTLARAQQSLGNRDAAIASWEQVSALRPGEPSAWFELGELYENAGRRDRAASAYFAGLQLDFTHPRPRRRLAWILATAPDAGLRNGRIAVELAQWAAQSFDAASNPRYSETLAAAYAESGDYAAAIKTQEQALKDLEQFESAPAEGDTPASDRASLQLRLALYQAGKPYRETASSRDWASLSTGAP